MTSTILLLVLLQTSTVLEGRAAPSARPGGDARTPISGAVVITQPGHYFVTRDIHVDNGPVIQVQSDNVTIDLNGSTVSNSGVLGTIEATGSRLVLMNGRIMGAAVGIRHSADGARLRVEDVRVEVAGLEAAGIVVAGAKHFELLDSSVEVEGCRGLEVRGDFAGQVAGSVIRLRGDCAANSIIELDGIDGGFFARNSVHYQYNEAGTSRALRIHGRGNTIIESNSFSGLSGGGGRGISIEAPYCSVLRNTISPGFAKGAITLNSSGNLVESNILFGGNDAGGIQVIGSDNTVKQNRVLHYCGGSSGISVGGSRNYVGHNQVSAACGYAGVSVEGTSNLIEQNTVTGLFYGLRVGGTGNTYRGNLLRGNDVPISNFGTGNHDDGGNTY